MEEQPDPPPSSLKRERARGGIMSDPGPCALVSTHYSKSPRIRTMKVLMFEINGVFPYLYVVQSWTSTTWSSISAGPNGATWETCVPYTSWGTPSRASTEACLTP